MQDVAGPTSARRDVSVMVILLGVLYLAGLGTPGILDYDEAAYAETARRMVRSGDYLTPRLADEEFFEKPPLLYWWISAGFAAFGVNEWGARVPSALATLLTALLLYGFMRRAGRASIALPTALVFGLSLEVFGLARLALTDAGLTLLTTVLLLAGYRAVTRDGPARWSTILLLGATTGLAILAKGFVGLVVPAGVIGTFLLLRGRLRVGLRRLAPLRTLLVAAAVAAPWFVLMSIRHGVGPFFEEFFIRHHLERFLKPMEGHSGPPFYYLAVLLVGFFPWVALLPHALANAWPRRGSGRGPDGEPRDLDRREDLPLFALIWAALVLVFFTVSGTKLPQYIAPVYPALAILVGLLWPRLEDATRAVSMLRWPRRGLAGLSIVLGCATLAIPWLVDVLRGRLPPDKLEKNPFLMEPLGVPPALIALGLTFLVMGILLAVRGGRVVVFRRVLLGGSVVLLLAVVGLGPRVDSFVSAPLRGLAREAGRLTPPGDPVVIINLRRVPSVAFYADRPHLRIRKRKAGTLRDMVAAGKPFAGIAPATRVDLDRIGAVEGVRVVRKAGGYVLFSNVD